MVGRTTRRRSVLDFHCNDGYPEWLPKDHHATCHGGGRINSQAVVNMTVEEREGHKVIRVFEPDKHQQAKAIKALLDGQATKDNPAA